MLYIQLIQIQYVMGTKYRGLNYTLSTLFNSVLFLILHIEVRTLTMAYVAARRTIMKKRTNIDRNGTIVHRN